MSKGKRNQVQAKHVVPTRLTGPPPRRSDSQEQKPEGLRGRAVRYGWIVPLLLSLIVNANVLLNGFTWDDKIFYDDSADPASPPNSSAAAPGIYYRPLIGWSYALDRTLWGLNPFGFHLSVYLAHAFTVLLIYGSAVVLLRLYQKETEIALIVASLFAVHPIHAEAVAWISGRNDVFMALFVMTALYAYLRYRQGAAAWLALPLFALGCVLGLLSKETAIPFLLIFPALDFLFHRSGRIRWHGRKDPLTWIGGIALLSFILQRLSAVPMPSAHREGAASFGSEVMALFVALGYYLKLLFVPYPLNLFVSELPKGNLQALFYLALGAGGVAAVVWILIRWNRTLFAVGAVWFGLGMIAPLVVPLAKVAVTPVAERYTYLASGGFLLLAGLGLFEGWKRVQARSAVPMDVRWGVGGLCLLVGLFSVLTVDRNGVWRNEVRVWEDAVRKSPKAVLPHYNLGIAYRSTGKPERSVEEFKATLKLNPAYPMAHTNLGNTYKEMGRLEEAVEEYRLELQPSGQTASSDQEKPHNNLGVAYQEMGRREEALQEFQTAIQLQPDSAKPHFNLGSLYEELNRPDDAIAEYRAGLKINPNDGLARRKLADALAQSGRTEEAEKENQIALKLQPSLQKPQPDSGVAHYNRGIGLTDQGRLDEAIAEFQTAVRLDPDYQNAHYNLGLAYANRGKFPEAIAEFKTVTRLKPNDAAAHSVLGDIYKDMGRLEDATMEYQTALRLDPGQAESHFNLAQVYGRSGKLAEARKEYERALQLRPDFPAARKALEFLPK